MFRIDTNRTAFVAFIACLLIIGIQQNSAWAKYKYNGECWAVTQDPNTGKNLIVKISAKGEIYPNNIIEGFEHPQALAVNPRDGSLWVADAAADAVFYFGFDDKGAIANQASANKLGKPRCLSLNPADGTVWVGTYNEGRNVGGAVKLSVEVKTSADGQEQLVIKKLATIRGLKENSIAVNIKDGNLWVADNSGRILKYDANGARLLESPVKLKEPKYIAVDPRDGSVWVDDTQAATLVKLDATGKEILRKKDITMPSALSLNHLDGSVWIADSGGGRFVKLSANGQIVAQVPGFMVPTSVSVDPKDGGAWIADQGMGDFMPGQIVKVSKQGRAVTNPISGLSSPSFVTAGYWKE